MKIFVAATFLFAYASAFAFASEKCYQVSTTPDAWSKTPELICIDGNPETNEYALTLKSGLSFAQKTVAVFNLNLLARARCMDCNQDHYGLSNPSNSTFNSLSIRFDGRLHSSTQKEQGTVHIGATPLYYRSL